MQGLQSLKRGGSLSLARRKGSSLQGCSMQMRTGWRSASCVDRNCQPSRCPIIWPMTTRSTPIEELKPTPAGLKFFRGDYPASENDPDNPSASVLNMETC